METRRLTRDGTAEPILRDHILRRERGQRNINSPIQLTTSRIGNLTRLIHTLAICVTIHNYNRDSDIPKICVICARAQILLPCVSGFLCASDLLELDSYVQQITRHVHRYVSPVVNFYQLSLSFQDPGSES